MIVVNGEGLDIEGLVTTSYREDRKLVLIPKIKRTRRSRVQGVVLHTTKGIPGGKDLRAQDIRKGRGLSTKAGLRCARVWNSQAQSPDPEKVKLSSAHLVVDADAAVYCLADLQREVTYHAGKVNERTVGIEIWQGSEAEIYEDQILAVVSLSNWLCDTFSIPKQVQWPYRRCAVPALEVGAVNCAGIWGHRDCSNTRGLGDPGDAVIQALIDAGYEAVDFAEPPADVL